MKNSDVYPKGGVKMRRKAKNHPFSDQWLEDMLKAIQDSVETQGIKPALSQILQTLINAIMEKEREIFLREHPKKTPLTASIKESFAFPLATSTFPSDQLSCLKDGKGLIKTAKNSS